MTTKKELIHEIAKAALKAKLPMDITRGGKLHLWVLKNVTGYPKDKEFDLMVGIAAEMADIRAQQQGYKDQFDRAASIVLRKKGNKVLPKTKGKKRTLRGKK